MSKIDRMIDRMTADGLLPLRVEVGDALDRVERACIAVEMALDDGRPDQTRELIDTMMRQLCSGRYTRWEQS